MKLTHWNWVAVAVTVGSAVAVGLGCSSNSSSSGTDGGTSSSSSGSSSGSTSSSGSSSGSGSGSSSGSGSGSGSSSGGTDGGSDGGGTPSIAITSPMDMAMVTAQASDAGTDKIVPVDFTLTNFTLVPPGTASCSNTSDNCGHIHLLIDSATACGAPPYNNAITSGTEGDAIVSKCTTPNGMHTIILELHHNDHTPVKVNGTTVSAKVQVTVSGA